MTQSEIGQTIDPSDPSHPLHCLTLSILESQTQAVEVFNSSDFVLIDASIIQQKLKQCGLIYLLSNNQNKEIINFLKNKNVITNVIKYKIPQKINYFKLCNKMSSILNSNNNAPNKVYAINCKKYHYFHQITNIPTQNDSDADSDDDDEYEYDDSSEDDVFRIIIDPDDADEKGKDELIAFETNKNNNFQYFRQYILDKNTKPPLDMLTVTGILNEYHFDTFATKNTENENKNELICVNYCFARNKLPAFYACDNYICVEMDLKNLYNDWNRPKLNVVIILDISKSMKNLFNFLEKTKSKMDITKYILGELLKNKINKYDRFGLIVFNNNNIHNIQTLQFMRDVDLNALQENINTIKANDADTNTDKSDVCNAYNAGIELFNDAIKENKNNEYQHRIIFLSDCDAIGVNNDNLMELNLENSLKRNIYSSFVGIGLEFDEEFIEYIYKCKGCNCLTVHCEKEYIKKMYNDFDLMVTPIAFNMSVQLISNDNSRVIDSIYTYGIKDIGTNNNGEIMHIGTLFAGNKQSKKRFVVVKLREAKDDNYDAPVTYNDFKIEHRLKYEYDIEYEFDVCNIPYTESAMSIEELMEHYTIKREWTDDHHKLITFLHENKIYNTFDLTDNQNINKIKKILSIKASNGDIGAKKIEIKLQHFMNFISPLINRFKKNNFSNNKVKASVESSRFAILLQKYINTLLLSKKQKNPSLKQSNSSQINIKYQETKEAEMKETKDVYYNLEMIIKYEDNKYNTHNIKKRINVNIKNQNEYFANKSIRKVILLLNYLKMCKVWIHDTNNNNFDKTTFEYLETNFIPYFKSEINKIGCDIETNDNLLQEIEILQKMVTISKNKENKMKINEIFNKNKDMHMNQQMILSYNPLQCLCLSSSSMKHILNPTDIYNNAFYQGLISCDYNICKLIPNYLDSPDPLIAIYNLSKHNKKHSIILVPIYINLNPQFLKTKCILIAHEIEALTPHQTMFYYHGMVLAVKKIRNEQNSFNNSLHDEVELINLLQTNIDYTDTSKISRKYPFIISNYIKQWLNVGCGVLSIHQINGHCIDVCKYIDDKNAKQQLQKLLFLCNIDAQIPFNKQDVIVNEYQCVICNDLVINPCNIIGNENESECKHIFCNLCIKTKNNQCPIENCNVKVQDVVMNKELAIKIKQDLNIPITIYKQIARMRNIMDKRGKALDEYYTQREEELNIFQNDVQLQQQIMNNPDLAHTMAGY